MLLYYPCVALNSTLGTKLIFFNKILFFAVIAVLIKATVYIFLFEKRYYLLSRSGRKFWIKL